MSVQQGYLHVDLFLFIMQGINTVTLEIWKEFWLPVRFYVGDYIFSLWWIGCWMRDLLLVCKTCCSLLILGDCCCSWFLMGPFWGVSNVLLDIVQCPPPLFLKLFFNMFYVKMCVLMWTSWQVHMPLTPSPKTAFLLTPLLLKTHMSM